MAHPHKSGNGDFHTALISVVAIYIFLKWVFPRLAQSVIGSENLLPIPGALNAIFMIMTVLSAIVYLSISDHGLGELKQRMIDLIAGRASARVGNRMMPGVIVFLAVVLISRWILGDASAGLFVALYALVVGFATQTVGPAFRWGRRGVFVFFPLLVAWSAFEQASPERRAPTTLRIQHPTIPGSYENVENPFTDVDVETRAALIEDGKVLYQINCRPCHGTKADGDGPMARALRLKPADFTDPGTIATLVESYALWRIREGGIGLPPEASPWDSAMPAWKDDLTDEEIWKIIMAEYEMAGVEPRKPEQIH